MYRAYLVPDATQFKNRSAMYQAKLLMWDPRSESDAYAVIGPKFKGELNKAEGFEFTILPANIRYSQIRKKLSVVIIYDDDEWIFEGVVSDCPKDFYKQMKVSCSGPLSYLCDSVQAPDEKNTVSIPTASGDTYAQVPGQWYNNANPHEQGWQERSYDEDGGTYVYKLTSDTSPKNKTYYYVVSGDNQNHSGSTITKKAATKETIQAHLERLLAVHNSQVDAFKNISMGLCVGDSTVHEFKSSNYRETWSAIKSDIIEQYGRYITIRMDDHYTLKLNYLELRDMDAHSTPETSITFTDNMIEMTESDDSDDDIFTVLVPTGKNNLTLDKLSGHTSPEHGDNRMVDPYVASWGDNKRYIVVSNYAIGRYGYIVKTQSFSDVSKVADLWTSAVKYIKNNFDAHTEYEVKGIDKYLLGESNVRTVVGKKCRVKSGWHGVDEKDLYVISAEHDLASPENDTYKIGIPTSDREARNKTLTGQTTSSSTSSANNYANAASAIASLTDILDKYASEHEGWLDLSYKIRNKVESDNGMFLTRFEQDESHINLMAQKVFGVAGSDDVDNQDAGWILIPKPPYRRTGNGVEDYYESSDSANTTYKVPSVHNWYVKGSDGKYTLSTQDTRVTQAQVNDPNVNFYIMRLATRVSMIDVGEGGIKARVDGNYERSTYCSSWIDMNEDAILALTGHLYVDEDGHVHVTSGSGMRTDHEEVASTLKYILVERSSYTSTTNPANKHWYERKLDSTKAWLGQGQADADTNDDYYIPTTDTTVDRNKFYYYKSYIRETFVAEYGVYDEDNLTAGVMAKVINHPTYHKVPMTELNDHKSKGHSPNALGWFEYNEKTGTYGLTLDTEIGDITNTKYYTSTNNMESWSYLTGDHIVIGKVSSEYVQVPKSEYAGANPHTAGWYEQKANGTYARSSDGQALDTKMYYRKQETYNGMNEQTQSRVARYIEGHNLDGTITEIASDVLYVHALFTEYLDVLSHKIFGVDDQDSGFVAVTNTTGKNPVAEGWYELVNGKYVPTSDDAVKSGKTYYARRITERITNFNVDENGIHGIVEGNYKRSTNSASWIEANEDQILAITGHIYVDENGQVIIKNGSGFRTGHTDPVSTHKYVQVKKSDYSGSPSSKGWYERKLDANDKWLGEGQSNSQTSDAYYERSTDTSCSLNKYYYTLATTEEEFYSDYGVYDENNLKAGIIARMINNPQYEPMPSNWYSGSHNPKSEGLYVLTDKGSMAATTDTSIESGTTYYKKTNSSTGWTAVKGEHVVIGYTDGYSGLDPAIKTKVSQYLGENLNGTITEIASDVVTVNTLLAKYIEADEIVADTSLSTDNLDFNYGMCFGSLEFWTGSGYPESGTTIDYNMVSAYNVETGALIISSSKADNDIIIGSGYTSEGSADADPADLVVGFGTVTTDGDTVKIPYLTAGDSGSYDNDHVITFDKPAVFGRVAWMDGEVVKTYTAGDKLFWEANLLITKNYSGVSVSYQRKGEDFDDLNFSFLKTKPTLKATLEVTGTWTDESHDDEEDDPHITAWEKPIFIDATKAYDDGHDQGETDVKTNAVLHGPTKFTPGSDTELNEHVASVSSSTTYDTYYSYHNTYNNATFGDYKYFKTPSKGSLRTYAKRGNNEYTSGTVDLGYGGQITAYGQRKMDGESEWTSSTALGITFKAPSLGSTSTYYERWDGDSWEGTSLTSDSSITLDYSESVKIKGRHQDGYDDWHNGKILTITSKKDRYSDGKTDGKNAVSISSPASATAPSGVTPTELAYGTTYEVHKVYGGSNAGGSVYFKTKADNSTTPKSGSISLTKDTGTNDAGYTSQGSGYTQLFKDVTFTNQKWYRFKVTCSGDTMVTTTKYYAIYVKTS